MEKVWKSSKVIAFVLSLTAFVYVGYLISQKGRYQPISNAVPTAVIDTQTGIIYIHDSSEGKDTYYKYDSQNQSMKIKTIETDTLLAE
ncbi:hypothetical protein [Flavobacterium nitratireducens]|uniref:hypothetical protein n=1 Tax=Flavobacterium nitratireducens TaxID=992289 RepID=UPI00241553A9|nr:hypothetical protein [Flavobacterium nitratireducens]